METRRSCIPNKNSHVGIPGLKWLSRINLSERADPDHMEAPLRDPTAREKAGRKSTKGTMCLYALKLTRVFLLPESAISSSPGTSASPGPKKWFRG